MRYVPQSKRKLADAPECVNSSRRRRVISRLPSSGAILQCVCTVWDAPCAAAIDGQCGDAKQLLSGSRRASARSTWGAAPGDDAAYYAHDDSDVGNAAARSATSAHNDAHAELWGVDGDDWFVRCGSSFL